MDWIFWLGLALGAAISFPVSVLANLWTDRAREYLGKRRQIRLSNRKAKEIATYLKIRAIVEGDPTVKAVFDLERLSATRSLLMAILGMSIIGIGFTVFLSPAFEEHKRTVRIFLFVYLAMTGIVGLNSFYEHYLMVQIRSKLGRFREYENRIREKWGDDAIEDFLTAR